MWFFRCNNRCVPNCWTLKGTWKKLHKKKIPNQKNLPKDFLTIVTCRPPPSIQLKVADLLRYFSTFDIIFLYFLVVFDGLTLNNKLTLIIIFFNTKYLSRSIKITDNWIVKYWLYALQAENRNFNLVKLNCIWIVIIIRISPNSGARKEAHGRIWGEEGNSDYG